MNLVFSLASITRHNEIEVLIRAAFSPYVRKLGRESDISYAWLEPAIRRGDVHVATRDETIVGAVACSCLADEMAIDHLAVSPDFQGAGIGSWLLANVERIARAGGIRTLSLNTAEIMGDLLRFYARHGFSEVHRAPAEHGLDPIPRVFMKRDL